MWKLNNAIWYWGQVRANTPSIKWNNRKKYALDNVYAPEADAIFVEQFKTFNPFEGQKINMHHMNQENKVGIALRSE
ncbi:hypothetical protein BW716_34045 [[Flexibacter] sp. ATCC 35208]|nr:hypothetical protein BW716_34045 [[Flexibacter] sp. ATCC 35208]